MHIICFHRLSYSSQGYLEGRDLHFGFQVAQCFSAYQQELRLLLTFYFQSTTSLGLSCASLQCCLDPVATHEEMSIIEMLKKSVQCCQYTERNEELFHAFNKGDTNRPFEG